MNGFWTWVQCFQWWNFIEACCYLGLGIKTIWAWEGFNQTESTLASGTASDNAIQCALAMGSLCVINGLVFLFDTIIAYQTKKNLNREAYWSALQPKCIPSFFFHKILQDVYDWRISILQWIINLRIQYSRMHSAQTLLNGTLKDPQLGVWYKLDRCNT